MGLSALRGEWKNRPSAMEFRAICSATTSTHSKQSTHPVAPPLRERGSPPARHGQPGDSTRQRLRPPPQDRGSPCGAAPWFIMRRARSVSSRDVARIASASAGAHTSRPPRMPSKDMSNRSCTQDVVGNPGHGCAPASRAAGSEAAAACEEGGAPAAHGVRFSAVHGGVRGEEELSCPPCLPTRSRSINA